MTPEEIQAAFAAQIEINRQANERLTRIENIVESNNRYLEALGQDLRRYADSMDRITQQLAGVVAASNQDRMDITTRLSRIDRTVNAIAQKLEVSQ